MIAASRRAWSRRTRLATDAEIVERRDQGRLEHLIEIPADARVRRSEPLGVADSAFYRHGVVPSV